MKLADAPESVRADLALVRAGWCGQPDRMPLAGRLWFGKADRTTPDRRDRCAMCGEPEIGEVLQNDHCHYSGLWRGWLCRDCNLSEGRSDAPRFEWWRLHAPGLAKREVHGPEGLLNGFTHAELDTMPMVDLLADTRARYISGHQFYLWQMASYVGLHRTAPGRTTKERAA